MLRGQNWSSSGRSDFQNAADQWGWSKWDWEPVFEVKPVGLSIEVDDFDELRMKGKSLGKSIGRSLSPNDAAVR